MTTPGKRAPPPLIFDDGSRVMTEEPTEVAPMDTPTSIRGSVSLERYYEMDRITEELAVEYAKRTTKDELFRVALQFPDELLDDSPDVCWLLEERLSEIMTATPLVFCLGDTTVGSCCPDEVAALHLEAEVLVHYGHACLSPTGTLPVIYSFGRLECNVDAAVECLRQEENIIPPKILLLYQVGYYHVMQALEAKMIEQGSQVVATGKIPQPTEKKARIIRSGGGGGGCCGGEDNSEDCCGNGSEVIKEKEDESFPVTPPIQEKHDEQPTRRPLLVGGLELPATISSWEELSDYTILFVGESESTSQKQYVNIMLQFLSLTAPPDRCWTYSPKAQSLTTSIPPAIRKQLNRRFFLSQKARDAHVIGILVSNLSQQFLVQVVKALKQRIKDAGKTSYSFAVGKINPAKLSNFAEIECFVLVACREHSLLSDEREYPVPVITPLELDVGLGNLEWGGQAYSLDCHDVLNYNSASGIPTGNGNDDDDDAPYFSLVTGKYVQKTSTATDVLDLELLPGKGQVTAYNSEAAKFLKQREYQGLNTLAGQTEAKAAVAGQQGIASEYTAKYISNLAKVEA